MKRRIQLDSYHTFIATKNEVNDVLVSNTSTGTPNSFNARAPFQNRTKLDVDVIYSFTEPAQTSSDDQVFKEEVFNKNDLIQSFIKFFSRVLTSKICSQQRSMELHSTE